MTFIVTNLLRTDDLGELRLNFSKYLEIFLMQLLLWQNELYLTEMLLKFTIFNRMFV